MPWSDLVEDAVVETDGSLLLAKLRGADLIGIVWTELAREPLLLHQLPRPLPVRVYASERLGFSILYPKDWEIDESDPGVTTFTDPRGRLGRLLVEEVGSEGLGLEELSDGVASRLGAAFQDVYVLETDEASTAGLLSSVRVEVAARDGDGTVRATVLLQRSGERVFMVLGVSPERWFQTARPSLEAAMESFQADPSAQAGRPGPFERPPGR